MRVRSLVAVAATAVIAPLALASTATAAISSFTISVVHGIAIPDFEVVDVYVNGDLTIEDFTYGTVVEVELPAGTYDVDVTLPDAPIEDAALVDTFDVEGDVSIVAQVDEFSEPELVAYADDLSAPAAGQSRVVVRHAAGAPPVSVSANGATVIPTASNGESAPLDVPAGSYDIVVSVDDVPVPGLSADDFAVAAGTIYTVYATGYDFSDIELSEVDDENEFPDTFYAFVIDEDTTLAPPATTAPATTAPASTTPAIPTAVPAGDGSAGWTGPLGLPALLALTLAAAGAVGAGVALNRRTVTGTRR